MESKYILFQPFLSFHNSEDSMNWNFMNNSKRYPTSLINGYSYKPLINLICVDEILYASPVTSTPIKRELA